MFGASGLRELLARSQVPGAVAAVAFKMQVILTYR
jgi:hypothetical protein